MKFVDYYANWIEINKSHQVAKVTLKKYQMSAIHLQNIAGDMMISEINRVKLQQIFTEFGKTHHRRTVNDFVNMIYACVVDAYDEGLIERLPVRKFINNGHSKKRAKHKYLSQKELSELLNALNFGEQMTYDYFILLLAKTGLRFAEALALTKEDIDLDKRTLRVNKSLDYKGIETGDTLAIKKTKTQSSNRVISLDWHFVVAFSNILKSIKDGEMIFKNLIGKGGNIHNSAVNDFLKKACKRANIPVISAHSLRHTHASILIAEGVSTLSVSKRLGHASTEVTQKVYIHLTKELEAKDAQTMVKALSGIF